MKKPKIRNRTFWPYPSRQSIQRAIKSPKQRAMTAGLLPALSSASLSSVLTHCPRDYHAVNSLSHRGDCRLNPQEFTYSSPIPKMEELQPVYVNVGSVDVDVVYSQVWSIQQPESSANIRTLLENKDSQVIYSSVKKS